MKIVILCGGEGIRFKNNVVDAPKVLANIGDRPILWHIMKYYQSFGYDQFILCLGRHKEQIIGEISSFKEDWNVIYRDTGLTTPTGGRVKMLEDLIVEDNFFVTYGDGLSDLDLEKLLAFHLSSNKTATLTTIRPYSQYGVIHMDENDQVTSFIEKPRMSTYVNGGFFVFHKSIFKYLEKDETLETSLFSKLVEKGELMAFRHEGFWKSMDTFKENIELNEIWRSGDSKWMVW